MPNANRTLLPVMLSLLCMSPTLRAQEENNSAHRFIAKFKNSAPVRFTNHRTIELYGTAEHALFVELSTDAIEPLAGLRKRDGSMRQNDETPVVLILNDPLPPDPINRLLSTGLFEHVEQDHVGYGHGICEITPNDQHYYNRQWSLYNDGSFNGSSEIDADIDMNHAWTITKGNTNTIVSTLDSGIKPDHPEFDGRIWSNSSETQNGLDDDNNGYADDLFGWDFAYNTNSPIDDHGHGTNVTGIIAANGNNSIGYAGVDWKCQLMTCKVLNNSNWGYYSWWISAIYYSVDNGADVINMSLGGSSSSASMENAIDYSFLSHVPVVVSMGNDNSSVPSYPAAFSSSIAVGATDVNNHRANPFAWGGGSNFGSNIDISAPGNSIYGLSYNSNTAFNSAWSGTSQAAPHVTGVVALLKGLNNAFTVTEIRSLLFDGAADLVGIPTEDVSGWDQYHGHGVLNAYKTLLLATRDTVHTCGDYTSPSGKIWTVEGVYFDTIQSSTGCDSVFVKDLLVGSLDVTTLSETVCGEYYWAAKDSIYFESGTYATTLNNVFGCDSTLILNLTIIPEKNILQDELTCDSYYWSVTGETYAQSGTYSWSGTASNGCDSIITLNLTVVATNGGFVVHNGPLLSANNTNADSYTWYKCDPQSEPVIVGSGVDYFVPESGYYALVVHSNNCIDTSECTYIDLLGLETPNAEAYINLAPNPTNGKISVNCNRSLLRIVVYDIYGRSILRTNHNELDLSDQPNGVYLIEVIGTDFRFTEKLVKTD